MQDSMAIDQLSHHLMIVLLVLLGVCGDYLVCKYIIDRMLREVSFRF
jgi:hypothetical protein